MPRFSIIIPGYNPGKYLKKCLESVVNQDYNDYEIVIVNDGSTDDSFKIVDDICVDIRNVKYYDYGKNRGLSYARNYGVSKASGDYILFLDSDDYFSDGFLRILNDSISDEEIVRFQCREVYEDRVVDHNEKSFSKLNGIDAFNRIVNSHYVENAWLYCFKSKFWKKFNFMFLEGTYHEDFGLIPYVLINSGCVSCISFVGYNYIQRAGSIMSSNNYDKILKKCNDFLIHFKFLKSKGSNVHGDLSIYNSFISNCVILKSTYLNYEDYRKYIKELKKYGAFDMILSDTFIRKIKKFFIKISPKLYYKLVRR